MKRRNLSILFVAVLLSVLFIKCKKENVDGEEDATDATFDKAAMFRNIGENLILPGYLDLKVSVDSLQYFSNLFNSNPTLENLGNIQACFKQAYLRFQLVSAFEFGPAENGSVLIRASCNTFPCDTVEVNRKIADADYDFSTNAAYPAKGFPALDFLLFGKLNNNDATLLKFTTGANASNRRSYLSGLLNDLKSKTDAVYEGWKPTGGNYLSTFINSKGSDQGSSLGLLVNQLNYDFEFLKNYKIAIPLGIRSAGVTYPHKVEAYYSQISVSLAGQQIKAIENLYLGRSKKGVDGVGLDDYLVHLKSEYNGGLLSDAIKTQLKKAIDKLQSLPDPLSQTIINNPSIVNASYIELQKQVVLFKTDMPSAMGVLITYQDNDGD